MRLSKSALWFGASNVSTVPAGNLLNALLSGAKTVIGLPLKVFVVSARIIEDSVEKLGDEEILSCIVFEGFIIDPSTFLALPGLLAVESVF